MEKDANYFAIGMFVSIGLLAMIGFLIWLAGTHDNRHYQDYTIYFTDPVSGLNEGANVLYKGVAVGKVMKIRLAPERKDLIKVDIEVGDTTPIRAGTKATLAMQGITGLVYIELTTEVNDTSPVPTVPGERYPVLKGSGTQVAKLLQDIPEISKQVMAITQKLNDLLDKDNMANLSQTFENVEHMTRDLNGLLSEENVANASNALQNISNASNNLTGIMTQLEQTTSNVNATLHKVDSLVVQSAGNVNNFTRNGLDEITETTRETRKMTESIRKTADKLGQNPSQIIYQPQPHGVEIPQ